MNSSDLSISAGIKSNKSRCCVLNIYLYSAVFTDFYEYCKKEDAPLRRCKNLNSIRQSTCQYGPNPSPNAQPRAKKKKEFASSRQPSAAIPTNFVIHSTGFFFLPFFAICCRSSAGFSARSLDNRTRTEEFC